MKNENDLIRFVLDQLLKHDGIVCSNTECPSYRKSVNDSILSTNEQKNHKSGEIHTDEENLNYNVLLHQEIIEFSKSNIRVSKSSAKQGKPIERKEQNTEFVSTSKQRRGQSQIKKSVIILDDSMVKHLSGYEKFKWVFCRIHHLNVRFMFVISAKTGVKRGA